MFIANSVYKFMTTCSLANWKILTVSAETIRSEYITHSASCTIIATNLTTP
jgi:hypothetical protein